ncbi:MAG: ribonuclease HI [Proteobacteria bacterium]|nr:ribonuclease HI [Pseudomonadota bacterium]
MTANKSDIVEIYTDGACSGNPGNGGWGAILLYNQHQKKISGSVCDTTNNQMELKAVIEALKILKRTVQIVVHTDSIYVKDGITKWIDNWKNNGWRTANKKPVKNLELWKELDELVANHQISWKWVKGHSGNKYNEIADQLATEAISR